MMSNDDLFRLLVMYKNDAMSEKAKVLARRLKRRIRPHLSQEATEITPLFSHLRISNVAEDASKSELSPALSEPLVKLHDDINADVCATTPWKVPDDLNRAVFFFCWPITFILWCTIPDPKRYKTFYILTFINCVLWIGCISYFVVFISTNVGECCVTCESLHCTNYREVYRQRDGHDILGSWNLITWSYFVSRCHGSRLWLDGNQQLNWFKHLRYSSLLRTSVAD